MNDKYLLNLQIPFCAEEREPVESNTEREHIGPSYVQQLLHAVNTLLLVAVGQSSHMRRDKPQKL